MERFTVIGADVNAGIVDEDVDASQLLFDLGRFPGHAIGIGHVEIVRFGDPAVFSDRSGNLLRIFKIDVAHCNGSTVIGKHLSHSRSDCAACAGDECGLSFKINFHHD